MIRILFFLVLLCLVGLGLVWLLDRPGDIVLTWQGYRIETSVAVGLGVVLATAVAIAILWAILRFVFNIPSLMAVAARARKRTKGYAALSRGMVAAGAGDAAQARRSATEAGRHLPDEPLALLLKAQSAQLDGDRAKAEAAFSEMADRPETRLLGLRGLHVEAHRRGDTDAAHHYAHEAHKVAPLPWSAKAVLDHRAAQADWPAALAVLEGNISARLVTKEVGERQRAVLETAIGLDKEMTAPDEALRLARLALRRAPDLVPAATLAARLLRRKGDLRKATKIVEATWVRSPHPDLAALYVGMRHGDSATDRLARAKTLARLAQDDPESRVTVAQAALALRNFNAARAALRPLLDGETRPTVRICLIMAEIEEAETGGAGEVREWLARGSRAPRDPMWIADGVAATQWAPVSPVTGRLDAYVWQQPPEALRADIEALAAAPASRLEAPAEPAPLPEEPALPAPLPAPPPAAAIAEVREVPMVAPLSLAEEPLAMAAPPPIPPPPAVDLPTPKPPPANAPRPQPVVFPLPAAPDDPGLSASADRPAEPRRSRRSS